MFSLWLPLPFMTIFLSLLPFLSLHLFSHLYFIIYAHNSSFFIILSFNIPSSIMYVVLFFFLHLPSFPCSPSPTHSRAAVADLPETRGAAACPRHDLATDDHDGGGHIWGAAIQQATGVWTAEHHIRWTQPGKCLLFSSFITSRSRAKNNIWLGLSHIIHS